MTTNIPTQSSVSTRNLIIAFFNKYRQLAIFDRTNVLEPTDPPTPLTFELLAEDDSKRYVSFMVIDQMVGVVCIEHPDLSNYGFTDYDFSGDDCSIWFQCADGGNDPFIVIGMGDIRDGFASTDCFKIKNETESVIITCFNDFGVRVYSKNNNPPLTFDISENNRCEKKQP